MPAVSRADWGIHAHLAPFRVGFLGAFFVSVGMLIDLRFLLEEWPATVALLVAIFVTNTLINAIVLWFLGDSWKNGHYAAVRLCKPESSASSLRP